MQNAALQTVQLSEAEELKKIGGAFRTISEVASELGVQQHVLRFWETKFNQIRPMKRGGGRRYYRPEDVVLLKHIHTLLYSEGYTIKGAQKLLKGQSKGAIAAAHAATEAAEKARTTAQNAAPLTTVAAKPVELQAAPAKPAADLPPAVADLLQGMLSDLKQLRMMVSEAA
ncbi:MAG: MerR family transcriptional regulator [Proteobacteria bacterium]|nr:MerR family transcriptional regulator [Pseudomonadota bacterium]